jgi:electron transport complex protein RnfB
VPPSLAEQINNILPQTQCTKCGYPNCKAYAEAIANQQTNYNQCPPGGAEGVRRIASILQKPIISLNQAHGLERPRPVAVIDESTCIGCTLCIQACPVDAIMGANKQMHTVIPELCTGCDLCIDPCPVDCISMQEDNCKATGWEAWSSEEAQAARERFEARAIRLVRERQENEARLLAKAHEKLKLVNAENAVSQAELDEKERKRKIIADAIRKAAAKKDTVSSKPEKKNYE